MDDKTLTIITDKGEEILCEILFTTHITEFNKDYVVFVEKGTDTASAAIYHPTDNGQGKLEQITSEEEWNRLEELLDDFYNQNENGCTGSCDSCDKCEEEIEE